MLIAYDIETYSNCFTLAAECCDAPFKWSFEISEYRDDFEALMNWMHHMKVNGDTMVGFNNVGFDYPVIHMLTKAGNVGYRTLYEKALAIIQSQDANRFAHMVYPSDRYVPQLDLFKIHHFDNKARATSLKVIEFNMRLDNVSDLPFPVGTNLNPEQIKVLRKYNAHDVTATKAFYHKTLEQIAFRRALSEKHGKDFTNHSDVKIGKEIFQMELEKAGVQCYEYGPSGRQPKQTKRTHIRLNDCIPAMVQFQQPEFQRIHHWLEKQVITETKGVFKDLTANADGLEFVFGTGGLHASVSNKTFDADDEYMILDIDVESLYPSIAITQGYYPEHLGKQFVEVYKNLKAQRVSYKKGTSENAMLKLALNGVYGASGDVFSIFFDPQFTMKITLTGQMFLAMLAERLMGNGVEIIQVNTDGISMKVRRESLRDVEAIYHAWERETGLKLEAVEYKRMVIRDVNNYIAVKLDGSVKRKGAYEYDLEWHQNHSRLVVAKVAEKVLVEGVPIRETLENWPDKMDFMQRIKVPRSSRLVGVDADGDHLLENTQRYYVSKGGVQLIKIMPPLAKAPDKWRRIGVGSGWTVRPCNNIADAVLPVDFDYYVDEIEKLCLRVM